LDWLDPAWARRAGLQLGCERQAADDTKGDGDERDNDCCDVPMHPVGRR
jgi:hypothetical protein